MIAQWRMAANRFYTETRTTGWNSERCQAATPDHRSGNGSPAARERRQDVQAPLETVQARSRRRVGVNPAGAVSAGGLVKRAASRAELPRGSARGPTPL